MDLPILSWITFSPLVLGVLLLFLPAEPVKIPQRAAFAFSLVPFFLSLVMLYHFDPAVGQLQMTETVSWMPSLGIFYSLGVDGFSLWLVILTTLLTPVVILGSWTDIRHRVKEFLFFMLLLEWGMLGALVSVDLFLFFMFWELMLFPMAFVLGIWGGPRRYYALVKFVLYTMAGSALMLVGMLYLVLTHAASGPMTFDIVTLYNTALSHREEDLPLLGLCDRVLHQGANVPFSHLATRCSYRGADRWLGGSRGNLAEDGWLRLFALRDSPLSRLRRKRPFRSSSVFAWSGSSTARWWRTRNPT